MMLLADRLRAIEPQIRMAPWEGYEHFRGYAVLMMPFSTGHLLGLRVFPQNDFAPYQSVWHRTPDGDWSIYNDGPSLKTTCPRWWGPALHHAELRSVEVTWTGANDLHIEMEEPRFEWTMSLTAPFPLQIINIINATLPLWTWRFAPLRSFRERVFGMPFAFMTPSGQKALILPDQIFFIESAEATLAGQDLGLPTQLSEYPTIGNVRLPTLPIFMVGQAFAQIKDRDEYRRSRELVSQST